MKRNLFIALLCLVMAVVFISCDNHTHSYSDKWSSDETYHWHAATCEHKEEVKDKAEHNFGAWEKSTKDGSVKRTCSICKYEATADGTVISSATDLRTAIEKEGKTTIYLTSNLELESDITLNKGQDVTINLNGKDITFKDNTNDTNGTGTERFVISAQGEGKGGSLTIEGKGKISKKFSQDETYLKNSAKRAIFKIDGNIESTKSEDVACKLTIGKDVEVDGLCPIWVPSPSVGKCFDVTIDINGTITGYQPILINGSINNVDNDGKLIAEDRAVTLNINDGAKIIATVDAEPVYIPGYNKTTIGKAEIRSYSENGASKSALVIGGGKVTINGATITGGSTASKTTGLNGAMDVGSCCAIYVNQNQGTHYVDITINDGTFSGYVAFCETGGRTGEGYTPDPQKVTLAIKGGTFKNTGSDNLSVAVYSKEKTGFITGGTFSTSPDSKYIAEGYKAVADGESWKVVASK